MRRFIAIGVGLACLAPASAAAALQRYALSMFHFNVQYVAGGLVGSPVTQEELRPEDIEDAIIVESFAPVLEMYARHPMWGADIELQGYMLDVLAARHPDTLALLRDLALAGQVEVVSFHYSDQLFIAFPETEWIHSQALTQATFDLYDIPLGTSVFCQEGQSSIGMAARMAERGYTTMVWPKNLWFYQHGDFTPDPLYEFGDVQLVLGGAGAAWDDGTDQIETTWTFFDDGEKLATEDWDPYFPQFFVHSEEAVAEYEAGLAALEADGWVISSVADYVDAIDATVTPPPVPPLLDGTWQPSSTNGVFKWMGERTSWPGAPQDRDNHVRTLNYTAHRELVAAQTAADVAGIDADEALAAAWRLLALGEVTDASGINPYRGEMQYGIAHTAEALRIARDVIEQARAASGSASPVTIDPIAGTMAAGDDPPFVAGEDATGVVDIDLYTGDPARQATVEWEQLAPDHHRVTLRFSPGDGGNPTVGAVFDGEDVDELVTTIALDDGTPRTFSRSDFAFETYALATPLGLVSLGPDRFLIKDTGWVHLAAQVARDDGTVTFEDQTVDITEEAIWVFHVLDGSAEDAVDLARRINSARRLVR